MSTSAKAEPVNLLVTGAAGFIGYNYPQHPLLGVPLFAVFCVLLSPLHTLVRERGGSVWHAAVLHGTFNAAAGVLPPLYAIIAREFQANEPSLRVSVLDFDSTA